MRYPVINTSDATAYLNSKRAGSPLDLDRLTRIKGDGPELDQAFIVDLRADLAALKSRYGTDGLRSQKKANEFEGEAARCIHLRTAATPEILADADFWLWLSVVHFGEIVEWRYGDPENGAALANYGIGARSENLLYRLWLRADIVLDELGEDRYHLCQRGQIDFYRSHLFRQGYANVRSFARALLRFQYPNPDPVAPRLKVGQIRELVKRLRRLRANLFLEILEDQECQSVIETEAMQVPATL